jgi:hypothetical protein
MAIRTRPLTLTLLVAGVVLAAGAVILFQPWKLVVDDRVAEAVPVAAPSAPDAPASSAGPTVLARGELISHEHDTSGSVVVLELPDGSRVLRLEELDTSNGPDLQVWITDAPVIEGTDGWQVFDDGRFVDLGDLKGNIGSSNYPLPAEVDLAQLSSVTVWCQRFAVSFGAAALERAAA